MLATVEDLAMDLDGREPETLSYLGAPAVANGVLVMSCSASPAAPTGELMTPYGDSYHRSFSIVTILEADSAMDPTNNPAASVASTTSPSTSDS